MARRNRKLPALKPQDIQRFWSKVSKLPGQGPKGECWEWQRPKAKDGYAQIGIGRQNYFIHRVAYLIQFGIDPADKLVLHTCDNRACCRGEHLFLGTDLDNVQDCIKKNRRAPMPSDRPKGEQHPKVKLTEAQVINIRNANNNGTSEHSLALTYGVSRSTINYVCSRRGWKHVS